MPEIPEDALHAAARTTFPPTKEQP
jgi:hypothetical protein